MFVIMSVATDTRAVGEAAAVAIGGTVGLDALFGGPITGASMNPARSLGPPALAAAELGSIWIYILAPLLGAALGGLAYQFVRGEPTRPAAVESRASKTNAPRTQEVSGCLLVRAFLERRSPSWL
jgi:hypothetical protein